MDDSQIEAELDLAALQLDQRFNSSTADGGSSIASSLVNAFLEEEGITLTPLSKGGGGGGGDEAEEVKGEKYATIDDELRRIHTEGDSPSSSYAGPPSPQQEVSGGEEGEEEEEVVVVARTPEKQREGSSGDGERGGGNGGEGGIGRFMTDTPRSGVSSLGLSSPQRREGGGREGQGRTTTWQLVNHLLRHEGYRAVGGEDPQEMLNVLKQVLRDYRDRGEIIKSYTLERQRLSSEQRLADHRLSDAERVRSSLNSSLHTTESKLKDVEEEVEETRKSLGDRLKEAKVKNSHLAAQLKQSEHRVRVKVAYIDKLMAKLDAVVQREVKDKERERAAIRKLLQRDPRASDAKYMDLIGALDSARLRALDEAKTLKEEIRGLNDMLKEKDNYIMRKESGGTWRASGRQQEEDGAGRGVQQLIETVHDLERSLRQATKREQSMLKRSEALEDENRRLKGQVEHLEEEKTNLILELKSRPTMKLWKASQKRIEELEQQLQKAVDDAREASDIRELRRYMGVGELVRRDKLNFRLKLDRLDALPREVMKEVLKEICRLLELTDIADITPAVEKMTKAMSAIPRLERFVKDVCGYVAKKTKGEYYADGRPMSSEDQYRRMTMEEAAKAIKSWWEELQSYHQLRSLRSRLITRLSNRASTAAEEEGEELGTCVSSSSRQGISSLPATAMSDDQLLEAISNLIDFERQVMQSRKLQNEADELLAARPEILLHRVIQHFRYLFQVKSVDGLFPKMNELYLFTNEMENLTRVLKGQLGLPPTSSVNTLLVTLQKVIRRRREEEEGGVGGGMNGLGGEGEEGVDLQAAVSARGSKQQQQQQQQQQQREDEGQGGGGENEESFMTLSESEGDASPPFRNLPTIIGQRGGNSRPE